MATYSSIKSFKKEYNEQLPVEGVPVGSVSYIDGEFYIWDGIEWGKINTVIPPVPTSGTIYTSPGEYTWVAPEGVTSVSVVAVGGGGGGGHRGTHITNGSGGQGGCGAGLGWKNNIPVVPGQSYTVVVGAGGIGGSKSITDPGGDSYFISTSTVAGLGGPRGKDGDDADVQVVTPGGLYVGDGGGQGGSGGIGQSSVSSGVNQGGGGGGAGGYTGAGGAGGAADNPNVSTAGYIGTGGGGGGGSSATSITGGYRIGAGGGGGVGIFGQGDSGAGGALPTSGSTGTTFGGKGGSGGTDSEDNTYTGAYGPGSVGGLYGGGGGGPGLAFNGVDGASGAVRIIWGSDRLFPTTNTADSATLTAGSSENII